MRVKDKVAIVTGSGTGLGKAIATRLCSEGASVIVADINDEAMHTTVSELTAAGHKASGYKIDVTSRAQLKDLMNTIVEKFGRIDILVNNAGVTRHRPFLELNDEDWNVVLAVDLKGVFYCVQAAAPHMIRQGYGKVLNISSISGTGASSHAAGGSPAGNANSDLLTYGSANLSGFGADHGAEAGAAAALRLAGEPGKARPMRGGGRTAKRMRR